MAQALLVAPCRRAQRCSTAGSGAPVQQLQCGAELFHSMWALPRPGSKPIPLHGQADCEQWTAREAPVTYFIYRSEHMLTPDPSFITPVSPSVTTNLFSVSLDLFLFSK